MTTIQHKDIIDPNVHEPKNISTALINTVYVANGSSSGVWKRPDSTTLKGLTGDAASNNKRILSDGANGFRFITDASYASMVFSGNTTGFTMATASDPTLNTNSDYVLFTGTGAPWSLGTEVLGITFSTDRLTIGTTGVYKIDLWASITGFPTNTAKVSVKYKINGTTFSTRHPIAKSNSAGDADSLNGFGLLTLNSGDYVQLYLASSAAGSLVISDINTTLSLVKAS
jgi:hypothetical protein